MKIIDLLNKIANGEDVPKKIKYNNIIYDFDDRQSDYEHFALDHYDYFLDDINTFIQLNEEVEIIEDKKIKHIENYVDFANLKEDEKFDYLYEMESRIIDKLNSMEE